MDYDLTIVGGGFAGMACAFEAAQGGLKVCVLERKSTSGVKPHTTGLFVKEAALEWNLPEKFVKPVQGVKLYSPSLKSLDLKSSDYFFLATDTSAVLDWFADRARQAGATVLPKFEYVQARRVPDGILINNKLRTKFLIGADGAISRVARDFNLGKNKKFLVGIEKEFTGVKNVSENQLHCFFDPVLAHGYIAWVIPGFGVTQVGIASVHHCPPQNFDAFVQKLAPLFDFSDAKIVSHRGGLIPVGGPVKNIAADNVLLIGDAAGYVSPLTAGGIRSSLLMGKRAGQLLAQHAVQAGGDLVKILKSEMQNYRFKSFLRNMIELPGLGKMADWALGSKTFQKAARRVFFHRGD